MRLALSSAAAPDATLDDLLAACGRRGFAALELVEGDGHGIGPALRLADIAHIVAGTALEGIGIAAFRLGHPDRAVDPAVARFATALDAPIVASCEGVEGAMALADAAVPAFAGTAATLLLTCPLRPAEVERLRRAAESFPAGALGLAWDIDPATGGLDAAEGILEAGAGLIRHIRLLGGGPEAASHAGLGIGALMGRLALSGYSGTLALAPSTPRYRLAWSVWLGRRGGWGCGSKATEQDLVPITRMDDGEVPHEP